MSNSQDSSIKRVKISQIKRAPYNPENRVRERALRELIKSIERVGLIYPVAVNQKNELIDGHRRLAAAEKLGWEEIPVLIVSGDRAAIYGEVNSTARYMTGNDRLGVYLVAPEAIEAKQRQFLERAEQVLGRRILKRMMRAGAGPGHFRIARDIASYLERLNDDAFLRKTVTWMLTHRMARHARNMIMTGIPPQELEDAIKQNKAVRQKYIVE